MASYGQGIASVIGFVFAALFVISGLDLACQVRGWPSLGYRVRHWSADNPWLAAAFLVVLGTFLAHFFLNGQVSN